MSHPNSLKNLQPYKSGFVSPWKNSDTTVVRVPKCFKDSVLEYAHHLDDGQTLRDDQLFYRLKDIVEHKLNKVKGYNSNSAGKLFQELREMIDT